MGTNYYARKDCCVSCGRSDSELHIGKSTGGWTFSFRGYRDSCFETFDGSPITTWVTWKRVLSDPTVKIYNEYGDNITLVGFEALVEGTKVEQKNHCKYAQAAAEYMRYHADKDWLDDEGNSFTEGEFL